MMTLANYGLGSGKHKDSNYTKLLSKSLQIRNRAELALKQCLKIHFKVTPEKRTEIINSVKDYYSRIPFNALIWNKYQVKQCIIDSILLLDTEFNPSKAHDAFVTLEKMLINLVQLPWHREFRRIYTYSGLFRLGVSEPLIGVEEILKSAGFEPQPDQPQHLILPEELMPQVDEGESITGVLFDCYLAQVVFLDIIDVFDNNCKASKRLLEQRSGPVNCYSWIQAYFRERSHQTTEISCSNIRELLNNITNHLASNQVDTSAPSPRLGSCASERLRSSSQAINLTGSTPQERTKKFLAQQAQGEPELLKLPSNLETGRRLAQPSSPLISGKSHSSSHESVHSHRQSSGASSGAINQFLANNGFMGQQYASSNNSYQQQQSPTRLANDRSSTSKPLIDSSLDYIDAGSRYNNHSSHDSLQNHQIHTDPPHNDLEPLISKHDRRGIGPSQQKRSNGVYGSDNTSSSATASSWRHPDSSRRYLNDSSSHQQSSSNHNNYQSGTRETGVSTSRYPDISHLSYKKYDSRELSNGAMVNARRTTSSSYWSCVSCTYNNQIDSETCEICNERRR